MLALKYCVWGIKPAPVCTARWDQQDWDRYEDGFRPADYHGGRYDTEAWKAYVEMKNREKVREFYASFGLPDPNAQS